MIRFSNEEKGMILEYVDEMLEIFNITLRDEFEIDEEPSIICSGKMFYKKDFESLKTKVQKSLSLG